MGMAAATIPLASAITAGAIGGLIGGGDIQSIFVGAVSAGLFYGAGEVLGHGNPEAFSLKHLAKTAAHAAIGCAQSAASGGRCAPGAMAAGFASFAGPIVPDMGTVGNGVAQAVIGGVAAKLGGGKFENGAVTAAFGYLFNDVALACRSVGGTAANHCGLFVYHDDRKTGVIERQYSLQGVGTEFDPQLIRSDEQRSDTFDKGQRAFRQGPDDRIIIIAPPEGMSQRDFEESVIRVGDSYNAGSYCLFGQVYPNSNSAAAYPIYQSGGGIPKVPFWAPGLRYYAP